MRNKAPHHGAADMFVINHTFLPPLHLAPDRNLMSSASAFGCSGVCIVGQVCVT